jgi:hypothetical protein
VRSVGEVVAVRGEPRDDAEQVTQALPAEPLHVEDERNGWAKIRTAYDYPGWVRAEALDGVVDEGGSSPATVTRSRRRARTSARPTSGAA